MKLSFFSKEPKIPLLISGEPISTTDSFKFLGTHISNNLKWKINSDHIYKKANQRLFFLLQLKRFSVRKHLLIRCYTAIIQSMLTSSITVWYSSLDTHSRNKLQRIVNKASKIISTPLPSIESLNLKRSMSRVKKIISDPSHPAHHIFHLLPSERRYSSLPAKTSRFKNSFYPHAIHSEHPMTTSHSHLVHVLYTAWCCVFMLCLTGISLLYNTLY